MPQTLFFTPSFYNHKYPDQETYLNSINYNETLTVSMAKFSYNRMEKHRKYVLNNIKTLLAHKKSLMETLDLSEDQFNDFSSQLIQRGKQHDLSKYSEPEKIAYIYLNWKFDQEKTYSKKYQYPEGMEEIVKKAIQHHYQHNSHHSEFYCYKEDGTREDDKKRIKVLLKNMNDVDLLEMVADWMAISQEYKTKCTDYAIATIGDDKAKPFTEEQKIKIFKWINLFEPTHQANDKSEFIKENNSIQFGK